MASAKKTFLLGMTALGLLSGQAWAQQSPATTATAAAAGEEEIVVNARKRSEDIQSVPIAITAYTAEDLVERNISNFNDLGNSTPGVSITTVAGGTLQNVYVRGLAPANTANDLNVEANVGIFINGIYQTSRNTLDMISVLDVGQIEIAKGPQSALFGRSTFAGAMSIATARPTDAFEATGSVTVGVDDDYRVRASISGPIAEGLKGRLSAGYLTYDGYGENSAERDNNLGGTEKYAVSGTLEYSPTSNFTARLSAFATHSDTEMTPATLLPLSSFNCGTVNAAPNAGLPRLYCGELKAKEVSSITPNIPDTEAKSAQVSLDLNWDFDGFSLISTTGYTQGRNRTFNDYDGSSVGTLFGVCNLGAACTLATSYTRLVNVNLVSSGVERVNTFSQEFRIQSNGDSPFQWLAGVNYFDSDIPVGGTGIGTDISGLAANERFMAVSQTTTPLPASATGGAYDFTANPFIVANSLQQWLFSNYSDTGTVTSSVFGSLSYRFGDLTLGAEARYNEDDKRAQNFSVSNPLSQPGVNQPINDTDVPAKGVFPVAGLKFKNVFESFTPRFTADFQANPNVLLYASAAKGVRSGGFNTANAVSSTGILQSEVAYDEETNWTYELGGKSRLWDNTLLLNASIFHVDWTDAQVSSFTANPTATTPARIVRNAGDIKADGLELQTDFDISPMFAIGGSVIVSKTEFQSGAYDGSQNTQCRVGTAPNFTSAPGCPAIITVVTPGSTQYVPSLEGKRPQRSVESQWNIHATTNIPLSGDWSLTGRVDVSYSGPAFNNLINTTEFGERTLTNLRVGIGNERYTLSLWGNNIFDETYVANSINQPRAGVPFTNSVPEIYLGEGRRYGLTAAARF